MSSIGYLSARIAATAVVLLVAAACGGSGASSDSAQGALEANAAPPAGTLVQTESVEGLGTVLVDSHGMTLYTTTAERDGSVACTGTCTDMWVPLAAHGKSIPRSVAGVQGRFSVVTRPDDTAQAALDGRPLYTFSQDQAPGEATGNDVEDDFQGTHFRWSAVTADGGTPQSSDRGGSGEDEGGGGFSY
ncbi:MAG: COG4315 family predicted lipoprotein [Actinomycetes bacterium]